MIILRLLLHNVFGLFSCILKILRVQRCPDSLESGLVRHPPKLISSLLSCNGVLRWTSVGGGAGSGGGLSKPGARQLTELLICGSFKLHGWNCYPLLHVSFLRKLESALVLLLMVPCFSLGEYMTECGYYKQVRTTEYTSTHTSMGIQHFTLHTSPDQCS